MRPMIVPILLLSLWGGPAKAETPSGSTPVEVQALIARCYVWNPKACDAQNKQADRNFFNSVTSKSSPSEAAKQMTARGWEFLLSQHDIKTAVFRFNQALIIDDKGADAWYGAGTAFAMLGAFDPAERLLRQASALAPARADIHVNLGRLYAITRHDLVSADREFRRAIELDPKLADGFLNLAFLALQQNKPQDAQAWADKAKAVGGVLPADFQRDLAAKRAPKK